MGRAPHAAETIAHWAEWMFAKPSLAPCPVGDWVAGGVKAPPGLMRLWSDGSRGRLPKQKAGEDDDSWSP